MKFLLGLSIASIASTLALNAPNAFAVGGVNCVINGAEYTCDSVPGQFQITLPTGTHYLALINNSGQYQQLTSVQASRQDWGYHGFMGEYCVNIDDFRSFCPESGQAAVNGGSTPPCAVTPTNHLGLARPGQVGTVNPYQGDIGCARKWSYTQQFDELRWGSPASGIGAMVAPGSKLYFGGLVFGVPNPTANMTYDVLIESIRSPLLPLRLPQYDVDLACSLTAPTYFNEVRRNWSNKTWKILSAQVYSAAGVHSQMVDGEVQVIIRNMTNGLVLQSWNEKTGSNVDQISGGPLPMSLINGGYSMINPPLSTIDVPPIHQVEIYVVNKCDPATTGRWGYAAWFNYFEVTP